LDGGTTIIRAVRTFRGKTVNAQLVSHIPLDGMILEQLQKRLRILPFLPHVRLQPAWYEMSFDLQSPSGIDLPLATTLVLPARDWSSGAPRWVIFRAQAFLPTGRELWSILPVLILLLLLPLGLSFWGAFGTLRRTVRPLARLLTGIRRVETGDLEYRLGSKGRSEIATSARAFDRMAASLQNNVQQLAEKKKVEEVSELKSRFVSMVSHDLKTPLSSIKGAAENVLGGLAGPLTERQSRYLKMILSSSKNLQKMISDLLDLSRIESGHLALELEILDLRHEVDNVLRSLQPLLDAQELSTQIIIDTPDSRVQADRTRLWQILSNLISNSVRYSPQGGTLEISVKEDPDQKTPVRRLITRITDTGPGVQEAEREHLFDQFYTRPVGNKGRHGVGLGLAIVKQLVELHEGKVWLDIQKKPGACFAFTMPVAPTTKMSARLD